MSKIIRLSLNYLFLSLLFLNYLFLSLLFLNFLFLSHLFLNYLFLSSLFLGLFSLSKRIEALGGVCGVGNRTDGREGCTFWFTFPYRLVFCVNFEMFVMFIHSIQSYCIALHVIVLLYSTIYM